MVGAADDGVVVLLARAEGGHRRALGGTQERLVALAREVGAVGVERARHGVISLTRSRVGVELGLERGRERHLHVGCGKSAQAEESHKALQDVRRGHDVIFLRLGCFGGSWVNKVVGGILSRDEERRVLWIREKNE